MSKKSNILTDIRLIDPKITRWIYSAYLQGESIEFIEKTLYIKYRTVLSEKEIDNIIDQMNELYL